MRTLAQIAHRLRNLLTVLLTDLLHLKGHVADEDEEGQRLLEESSSTAEEIGEIADELADREPRHGEGP